MTLFYPRLLGDLGGTNARFAWEAAQGWPLERLRSLPNAGFSGPEAAIRAYLALEGLPAPAWAALGVATPVQGDAVVMTNRAWAFSIEGLRAALGLGRLVVLNDFAALALALPVLPVSSLDSVGGGRAALGHPIGLLGAGTGLGVAGLLPCGENGLPIAGEGGHVTGDLTIGGVAVKWEVVK